MYSRQHKSDNAPMEVTLLFKNIQKILFKKRKTQICALYRVLLRLDIKAKHLQLEGVIKVQNLYKNFFLKKQKNVPSWTQNP